MMHFSKFMLNTYSDTPYFFSQLPAGYPLSIILQECKKFRGLPSNLRQLAKLSKVWASKHLPSLYPDMADWYDSDGYELEPGTGRRLTDKEIASQWGFRPDPASLDALDIPVPAGGFPDPDTWEEPEEKPVVIFRWGKVYEESDDIPTEKQLLNDISSHGREATAREYGIQIDQLPEVLPIQNAFCPGSNTDSSCSPTGRFAEVDPKTKAALDRFATCCQDTKNVDISGKSFDDIDRELMSKGWTKSELTIKRHPDGSPCKPYRMVFYETDEGGVVRLKPDGNPNEHFPELREPHGTKYFKADPDGGLGFDNEAFKIEDGDVPIPKTPKGLRLPSGVRPDSREAEEFVAKTWRTHTHVPLRRPS